MKSVSRLKIWFLLAIFGLCVLLSVFKTPIAQAAPANSPNPYPDIGVGIILNGNGSTDPSSYAVSGVLGDGTKVNFTYYASGGGISADGFYSVQQINGTYGGTCQGGNGSGTDSQATKKNQLTLTVTLNGKSAVSSSPVINLCNEEISYIYYHDVTVTNPSQVAATASLHGIITYVDENGKTLPIQSTATGTLTDTTTNQIITLSFDNSGDILGTGGGTTVSGLAAGDQYTLLVNYQPTDPDDPTLKTDTDSFKLTAGQDLDVSKTIPASGAVTTGTPGGATDGTTTEDPTAECEAGSSFSLNWILCPIYNGMESVSNSIFTNIITPQLKTKALCLDASGTACDNTIYKIWSNFRIYGDIFLIIVLLVVVFGESIGGGVIDAYTAKKILPRLLAAAILINLSIYIVALLVDLTNIVGGGIGQILTAPLANGGAFQITPGGVQQAEIGGLGLFAGITASLTLGVAGIILLLVGLAITAFIAFIGIFVTLILRQAIITVLILISPIAFALWCLPNTERWFKKWWDTLFQMMLVYPMIVMAFAVADILSAITAKGDGTLNDVISFMLLIIPLLSIPLMLRMSNRLLGQIQGAVGGVGQRLNAATGKRALGAAGGEAQKNIGQTFQGERFSNRNALTRRFNRVSGGVGTGWAGHFGIGARGEAGRDLQQRAKARERMRDPKMAEGAFDDNGIAVLALSGGSAAGARRAAMTLQANNGWNDDERDRAIATAQAMAGGRITTASAGAAMDLMAQNKSRALKGNLAGQAGIDLVRQSAVDIAGGNQQMAENMVGGFAFNSRNAGRLDLGGEVPGESLQAGWERASVAQHAQSYGTSMQAYAEAFTRDMTQGTADEKRAAAIAFSEMQNALPNATATNQGIINEAMSNIGVNHNLTVTEQVTRTRNKTDIRGNLERDPAGNVVTESYVENVTRPVTIEEQLSNISSGFTADGQYVRPATGIGPVRQRTAADAPIITARAIQGEARQYGSGVPYAEQGGGPGTPPPPAPPPAAATGGPPSDRRLKTDVHHIQTLDNGIKLYSFKYIWGNETYVGVMAQDLLTSHPEAVGLDSNGYYYVDYSVLGLKMMKLEEWLITETDQHSVR